MALHVIVGAGPVGRAVARELLDRGQQVRMVTRSGSGIDGTERVSANAADAQRLSELATGAAAIYNCVNPKYTDWERDWPPVANSLLAAAESSGAVLATTGNLYIYGEVSAPMTERTPLAATGKKGRVRIQMWRDAMAAHEAARVRAFEVRGSDYLGGNSLLSMMIAPALRKGRTAYVPAALDVPHTWTNVRDVAKLLVVGAGDDRAWGRAWHVPSAPACSVRQLTAIAAAQLGVGPKVRAIPQGVLWSAGLFSPLLRELRETQHQFRKPFVLDSSAAEREFGLVPATLEDSVALDMAEGSAAPLA
ncbi:MAG: NAD-dependent epimerase/dehydratase family protein [Jatrophihabitantaceae bacterium]